MIAVTQADGFAISMIAILATSFAFISVILFMVVRNARKGAAKLPEDPVPEARPSRRERKGAKASQEPWEKDADWWKS